MSKADKLLANRLLSETVDGVERWLNFNPAWDKRPKAPHEKNYGVHGAELVFGVKRANTAVVWVLMLDWYLPQVLQWWKEKGLSQLANRPFDGLGSIDYHSPVSLYEGHSKVEDCGWIGQDCYCDGSATASGELFAKMVAEGPAVVWKTLTEWLVETERRVKEQKQDERNFS